MKKKKLQCSVPTLLLAGVLCLTLAACGAKQLPHTACPECGQYGPRAARRQILES